MVAEIAREVGLMEQRVMAEEDEKDPQEFLSQLFAARHELLTIKPWPLRAARSTGGRSS
jgi:hypothetical protein